MDNNLYLLDESKNLTGTYKDRRSKYIVEKAIREGANKLCLITSGNAGISLCHFAKPHNLKVVCVVDNNINREIKERLEENCKAIVCDLSEKILKPEDIISLARETDDEVIWEVTNGYPKAYSRIVDEIRDREFDYIVCPVGSGEAYVGLYLGLKKLGLDKKIVGVGVESNPSFADKLSTTWTPYQNKINEILSEGHILVKLTEEEVKESFEIGKTKLRTLCCRCLAWY